MARALARETRLPPVALSGVRVHRGRCNDDTCAEHVNRDAVVTNHGDVAANGSLRAEVIVIPVAAGDHTGAPVRDRDAGLAEQV